MITEEMKDTALQIVAEYIVECAEYDKNVIADEQPDDTRTMDDLVEDMTVKMVDEIKETVLDIREVVEV